MDILKPVNAAYATKMAINLQLPTIKPGRPSLPTVLPSHLVRERFSMEDGRSLEKRIRTAFTEFQLAELEQEYKKSTYSQRLQRKIISERLALEDRVVKVWFQNRRMKEKRQLKGEGKVLKVPPKKPKKQKSIQIVAKQQAEEHVDTTYTSPLNASAPAPTTTTAPFYIPPPSYWYWPSGLGSLYNFPVYWYSKFSNSGYMDPGFNTVNPPPHTALKLTNEQQESTTKHEPTE